MEPDPAKPLEEALKLSAEAWNRQIDADVKAGKLDKFAERALRAHASGQSTEL